MATESATKADLPETTPEDILEGMGTIKRMLMAGAVFAAVGYLLVGAALFLEFTQILPVDRVVLRTTHRSQPRGRRRGPRGHGGAER